MKYICAALVFLICFPACAQTLPKGLKIDSYLTLQANALDNADLGTSNTDMDYSLSAQQRERVDYKFAPGYEALLDVRGVAISGDTGAEDETGRIALNRDYLEARQFWFKTDINKELSAQIGRQRIREDASLWWNRDIEAARLLFDTSQMKGFIGVAEAFGSYKTAPDSFRADQDDRLRVLGETSWQWDPDHALEARALYENDHSGMKTRGDMFNTQDRDDEDGNLGWIGLRAAGTFKGISAGPLHYKIDAMGVGGHEDELSSVYTPGTGTRRVTGKTGRDVLGWALDARADLTLDMPAKPVLMLGYAYGSGDDGGGTDHGFRQTGLQSNSSRTGASTSYMYDYGEVFRPELSNMHILTLGAGAPLGEFADINLFYHYYRLAEDASSLHYSLITAPLNATNKDLGQEADAVLNLNLSRLLGVKTDIRMRNSIGVFQSGEAYGRVEGDRAVRGFSELVFHF